MDKNQCFDKVGEVEYSPGWGVVRENLSDYPIYVSFERGAGTYTWDGYYILEDLNPSLFWDEIEVKAPPKPLPDLAVDTKVYVWDSLGQIRTFHTLTKMVASVCSSPVEPVTQGYIGAIRPHGLIGS